MHRLNVGLRVNRVKKGHWVIQGKYDKKDKWEDWAVGRTRKKATEMYQAYYGGVFEKDEEDGLARIRRVFEG